VLTSYLARETKLYHLAYLTPDLEQAIDRLPQRRAKLVVPPVSCGRIRRPRESHS
jgi:hypothetical protein